MLTMRTHSFVNMVLVRLVIGVVVSRWNFYIVRAEEKFVSVLIGILRLSITFSPSFSFLSRFQSQTTVHQIEQEF